MTPGLTNKSSASGTVTAVIVPQDQFQSRERKDDDEISNFNHVPSYAEMLTKSKLGFCLGFLSLGNCQEGQIPLALDNHVYIPSFGLGTWNLDKSNASEVVSAAIQIGYRHIDCAAIYGNEREVGRGIADGIKKAGIRRDELWVTSKLWNSHHQPYVVEVALDQSLSDLGLDYIDLYLMHWPVASTSGGNVINYVDTWHGLSAISRHKARNIGISNFSKGQVQRLFLESDVRPAVHQMELHPYLQQVDWVKWHREQDIKVTAYSPLGGTNPIYHPHGSGEKRSPPPLLQNPVLSKIAKQRGCTTAQVALAWGIARGTSVIPKSSHIDHLEENFFAVKCVLQEEDFEAIETNGRENVKRYNNPANEWGVELFEGLDGLAF